MSRLSFLILGLVAMMLFSSVSFAEINITDCGTIDIADIYLLQNDLNLSYDYGFCFYQTVNGASLDCQGHTIEGNSLTSTFISSAEYFTLKNCIVKNFYDTLVGGEDNVGSHFINNTITGVPSCIGGYYNSDLLWENNTVNNIANGCVPISGKDTLVRNNHFSASVYNPVIISPVDPNYYGNNKIYNNYFGQLPYVLSDIAFIQMDVSPRKGNGILGTNIIAGNFYNEDCDDLDCNGICDNPKVFNVNVTDFYPLSTCIDNLIVPNYVVPQTTLTELSKVNTCSGTILLTSTTYGYCGNSTCTTTVLESSHICQNGCNSEQTPNACNPSQSEINFMFWFFVIVAVLIIIGGIKYLLDKA